MAHLEAASIPAFLRLREEPALHGAEPSLQDAALPRLSEAERAAVLEARRMAVETLRAELRAPVDARLVTETGMPSPEAAALFVSLDESLWA